MSKIEQMKILGVRSFGNRGAGEIIKFDTPLTLIVGYNGSGKTTIIECLKFASTGQLPPNSKTGGAFIHDPKLCAEKEVMAQVKLKFSNSSGHQLVATRSMAVTVKKGGAVSQRALENNLLLYVHGERQSMSTTVQSMDKMVPENLGVSTAILDSVIFCHQEESLWPMSEPSVLKKKFDNIFEAQKYTQAIEVLKTLRKDRVDALKRLTLSEQHAKILKDKGEKVARILEVLHEEIEQLNQEADAFAQEIDAAAIVRDEKSAQAANALGLVNQIKTKQDRISNLEETLSTLSTNLVELPESDQWLSATLEQYKERMAELQGKADEYKSQYTTLQENLNVSRGQLSASQAEKGRHQAKKDHYENQLKARIDLVKEAARLHLLRGYHDEVDEGQAKEFVQRVQKLSQDKDRELNRIQAAAEEELRQVREVLNDLATRRTTRTQEKLNARQTIESNSKKSRVKQQEADRVKMDEGTKANLESSLSEKKSEWHKLTSDYEAAGWDEKLKTEEKILKDITTEASALKVELVQSNKLVSDRAELDVNRKNANKDKKTLEVMTKTYHSQLSDLIGADWQPQNLEREYQILVDRRVRELEDAKIQQQSTIDENNEISSTLKNHRTSLAQKREERQKCQEAVLASVTRDDGAAISSVDEYEPEVTTLRQLYEDTSRTSAEKVIVTEYYEKSVLHIEQKNACRMCVRPFANKAEKTSATERLRKLIAKAAQAEIDKSLQEDREALKQADAARVHYERFHQLSKEIPELEKDIRKVEDDRAVIIRRLDDRDRVVGEKEAAKLEAESISGTVTKIINLSTQIAQYEADIAKLSSQQKVVGVSLSVEEIGDQISAYEERIRTQNAKVKKLEGIRESAKNALTTLELEISIMGNNLGIAKHELEKKLGFLAIVDEYRENTLQQREIIKLADAELEALLPQVSQAESQREDTKQRSATKEQSVRLEKEKLADTVNKFAMIENGINNYLDNDGPSKLKLCIKTIQDLEKNIEETESELRIVTQEANELRKRIDDSDQTKRNILDNINYRRTQAALQEAKREIVELDQRSATDNYKDLTAEADAAALRYHVAAGKRGRVIGAMASKDAEFGRHDEEYKLEYQDAATKYRKSHILVETHKAAIEDLAKLTKALDAAIMQYHTLKMQEINQIAGELWRNTYQGTDVDTIMIRSDVENASSRRNYNYRVVMVKQDAEMDMRGRCSAGQKVLASIIIRLALAECFGVNCGVIALDEPTTNLDFDNIKSLAASLNQIIKARKHQSNFQLIIITHDEGFLKEMACSEFTDYYYRVERDQHQKSRIDRQRISDLM